MNFIMDEAEFFYTHQMVVYHLNKHPGYIKRCITAMKFPSLVTRQCKGNIKQEDAEIGHVEHPTQTSTSSSTTQKRKCVWKSKSTKKKSNVQVLPNVNIPNPLLY